MHTLVMDLEPGYIGTEPGFLYRFNRDLWQTITSSHLVLHTKPGRIKNFKLSGVTRQVETTGAQLLDVNQIPKGTEGGATLDIVDDQIIISGSGALTSTFGRSKKLTHEETMQLIGDNRTFTLSVTQYINPPAFVNFADASKNLMTLSTLTATSITRTIPENMDMDTLYIYYGVSNIAGAEIVPGTARVMLNAGDTALPWEPYTGATSSPSPEYPQDIQGVGVRTAQMLDFTKDITYGGCTLVDADTGTIKCDIVNDYYCVLKITYLNDYIMAHKGGNLTFYADQPLDTWLSIIIDGTRSSGETYQETTGKGKIVKATIADDFTSIRVLELRLNRKNATFTDTETIIPNLMLYEKNAVLPYEPYGYRTDVVTRSKNLLDRQRMLDFILQKSGASIVQFDGRRCLKLDGRFNFPDFNIYEDFEPEKRYTLTYEGLYEKYYTSTGSSNGFAFDYQEGTLYALIQVSDIGTWKRRVTTTNTGVKNMYFSYGTDGLVYIDLDTIQLEEGTISTPYQPYAYYTAPIYTREPLTQWDRIEYRNGEYGVARRGTTYTFTGQERFNKYGSNGFALTKPDMLPGNYRNDGYCNRFPCAKGTSATKGIWFGADNNQYIYFLDVLGVATSVSEFAAWLQANPTTIVYQLAEEVWEPLPTISQQALRNLPTYKGTTIIDTTDPLEPEITVLYRAAKKNFFNFDKVFNNPVEATGYFKYDLGLSPGNYVWSLQKNEFLGSDNQFVLITDDLGYDGSGITSGEIYQWIGHSTLANSCSTSGTFTITDEMYIAVHGGNVDAVKPLLKTLRIEKV